MPTWFLIVQALGLLVFAALGVAIAYRQYRTARDKLNLDLLERRFKVFVAFRDYVSVITPNGEPTLPDDQTFYREAVDPSRFLFGEDVSGYLDVTLKRGQRLRANNRFAADQPEGEARNRAIETAHEDFMTMMQAYEEGYKLFRRYMEFAHVRNVEPLGFVESLRKRIGI